MTRHLRSVLLALGIVALATSTVFADSPAEPKAAQASIPFVNRGGIRDWVVEDDANLLLQDRQGQWYRARLVGPAYYLAHSKGLLFATGPSGTLETFDSVVVYGQKYPIISLTRIDPPKLKRK
ncbi:DUF6491 family protein [Quatrionicoccus australiensis]|uniref:DUF6491 family protein n=1 Tax=Quatrionicoccus australiensis TaxID=138118 RepID=UPI001CFA8E86|nr:DUF6491 family protein [Quatrionicoccus australiensis]MCB4358825.1 hypothetical protein [Quatrionicoccus australiensis]